MKELKGLKTTVEKFDKLKGDYEDIETMIEMGYEENDESLIQMCIRDRLDCTDDLHELRAEYKKQAVLGDIIYPKVCREDGRSYVALCDHQDHVFVAAEIKYR